MIELTTPRLILRDHISQDIQTHHALMSDQAVMRYLQDIRTHSLDESRENLAFAISQAESPERTGYFLRMQIRDTGEHVGEIGYTVTEFTPQGKRVHLGYFTHKRFWGRGYVTEALKELMRFAFEDNDVECITTGCIAENIGSEHVMIKCGLVKDPEYHESEFHEGQYKQRVLYRLYRRQWQRHIRQNG